jgi:hypothetical protein
LSYRRPHAKNISQELRENNKRILQYNPNKKKTAQKSIIKHFVDKAIVDDDRTNNFMLT